ncbi:MAG: hypothetical protein WC827_01375 [Candidatus Paceibacterota bacterium]|jgi:hypothetical protein
MQILHTTREGVIVELDESNGRITVYSSSGKLNVVVPHSREIIVNGYKEREIVFKENILHGSKVEVGTKDPSIGVEIRFCG